jgi:hypothetical protein
MGKLLHTSYNGCELYYLLAGVKGRAESGGDVTVFSRLPGNGHSLNLCQKWRKTTMANRIRIGLIGDYNPEVKAHIAILFSLERSFSRNSQRTQM